MGRLKFLSESQGNLISNAFIQYLFNLLYGEDRMTLFFTFPNKTSYGSEFQLGEK